MEAHILHHAHHRRPDGVPIERETHPKADRAKTNHPAPARPSVPVERSAGAVVLRDVRGLPHYLLLHYGASHWDFPKGHIEPGETTDATIRREVKEETGIERLAFVPGFKETIRYAFSKPRSRVLKFVVYRLARTRTRRVRLSHEHQGFVWLPYEDALRRITFSSSRHVLEKAQAFLTAEATR